MVFGIDHPNIGWRNMPKGIREALKERELWRDSLRLECRSGCPATDTPGSMIQCCASRTLLALQQDFLNQQSRKLKHAVTMSYSIQSSIVQLNAIYETMTLIVYGLQL